MNFHVFFFFDENKVLAETFYDEERYLTFLARLKRLGFKGFHEIKPKSQFINLEQVKYIEIQEKE
jgi:hypothetical protein